jgi:hypothetical protein
VAAFPENLERAQVSHFVGIRLCRDGVIVKMFSIVQHAGEHIYIERIPNTLTSGNIGALYANEWNNSLSLKLADDLYRKLPRVHGAMCALALRAFGYPKIELGLKVTRKASRVCARNRNKHHWLFVCPRTWANAILLLYQFWDKHSGFTAEKR